MAAGVESYGDLIHATYRFLPRASASGYLPGADGGRYLARSNLLEGARVAQSVRPNLVASPLNQPPASQKQPIHNPLIQMPLWVRCHPAAVCRMQ